MSAGRPAPAPVEPGTVGAGFSAPFPVPPLVVPAGGRSWARRPRNLLAGRILLRLYARVELSFTVPSLILPFRTAAPADE